MINCYQPPNPPQSPFYKGGFKGILFKIGDTPFAVGFKYQTLKGEHIGSPLRGNVKRFRESSYPSFRRRPESRTRAILIPLLKRGISGRFYMTAGFNQTLKGEHRGSSLRGYSRNLREGLSIWRAEPALQINPSFFIGRLNE
jgi:hypothetical protein